MDKLLNRRRGFSLAELLISVTIFLFLVALVYWAVRGQMAKGRDAKRKDDLERIRVAFEDYFNDHGCYPDIDLLSNCGGDDLAPYLAEIPCDPETREPYIGVAGSFTLSDCNGWYKVYTFLENEDDSVIAKLGLSGGKTIDGKMVNYGVSSPNVAVGDIPATTFICPNGEPAPHTTECGNPSDYLERCGVCGCFQGEKVTQGPRGYYCCPDSECPDGG